MMASWGRVGGPAGWPFWTTAATRSPAGSLTALSSSRSRLSVSLATIGNPICLLGYAHRQSLDEKNPSGNVNSSRLSVPPASGNHLAYVANLMTHTPQTCLWW